MRKKKHRRRLGLPLFLLFVLLIAFLFYDSNTRLVTDEYPVRYSSLPAGFDGYRIVQLSDFHTAQYGKDNAVVIDAVKKARPDIIAVTGDLINSSDEMDEGLAVVRPLIRSLVKIAPVYYVTGNHEWAVSWLSELFKMLVDEGVTVLRNDYRKLTVGKSSIILAGIDDPNGPADMMSPEELIAEIRAKEGDPFIVLLAHRNNYLDRLSKTGVDLILCGHAHGGLIRVPFVGGVLGPSLDLFPKYTSGVYAEDGTSMVVSRGVGNHTGIPRFLNNPQLPVVVLKK